MKKYLLPTVAAGSALLFYEKHGRNKVDLQFQPTHFNQQLVPRLEHLKAYTPSLLVSHHWTQILWLKYFRPHSDLKLNYTRELIPLGDGGQMSVDWLNWPKKGEKIKHAKVILVWVGIGGSSDRSYIKYLVDFLAQGSNEDCKYICGVLHPRGAGDTELTTPLLYDFLRASDWEESVDYCVKKVESTKELKDNHSWFGAGVSIGANQIVNYCGHKGKDCLFKGIISFNNPWDLQLATTMIKTSKFEKFMLGGIMDAYFLRSKQFKKKTGEKKVTEEEHLGLSEMENLIFKEMKKKYNLDLKSLMKTRGFDQMNEELLSKILVHSPHQENDPDPNPFQTWKSSVSEFYTHSSSVLSIKGVTIPTLVIQAKDDPIINYECFPFHSCLANPNFILGITNRGGHFQYFEGKTHEPCLQKKAPLQDRVKGYFVPNGRWVGKVAKEFFDAVDEIKN